MTFPALLFGLALAAVYAAAFHFWRGDSFRKLLLYLLLSEVGFWAGHFLGARFHWTFAQVGPLYAGVGTLGSLLFLFVGRWLSLVEINQK